MAIQTNIHEAKTHLSRLLEQAHRGEDVIIAKDGKPYARLVPIRTAARRVPGAFRGLITGDVLGPMGPVDADWG
ncbi:MAG: type II toxin-antitoxin system prevent-host-death family antitoxin [Myxococcales bacterium]|nr:type II toxin-antitoxin system prevent-host-death family antitoxin [Myxococcales bacterium]